MAARLLRFFGAFLFATIATLAATVSGVVTDPAGRPAPGIRVTILNQLAAFLEERKILIRNCTGWSGIDDDNAVRVGARTRSDNEQLVAAWKEFTCSS